MEGSYYEISLKAFVTIAEEDPDTFEMVDVDYYGEASDTVTVMAGVTEPEPEPTPEPKPEPTPTPVPTPGPGSDATTEPTQPSDKPTPAPEPREEAVPSQTPQKSTIPNTGETAYPVWALFLVGSASLACAALTGNRRRHQDVWGSDTSFTAKRVMR